MSSNTANTLNKPMVSNLIGSHFTNGDHSIVYLNFSFVNQEPVNFLVPGEHTFSEGDKEANFFIPHGKENEFKQKMKDAPNHSDVRVNFHGMDGKVTGYYKLGRISNEGGGVLTSNATNPMSMSELNQKCFSLHQKDKTYFYVLDTLSFYSNIESEEMMIKALETDVGNLPKTESKVHLFVDSKFMTVNGKFNDFGKHWRSLMEDKGYMIHQAETSIPAAIQYVFGIKTPQMDISINEYISFDTSAGIDFAYCSSEMVSTIARSEGRISFQTNRSLISDVKIIAVLKGRVSNVTFLNESAELTSLTGELQEEYDTHLVTYQTIMNNMQFINGIDTSAPQKSLQDHAITIVNSMFCSPRSIALTDSSATIKLLDKLYEFTRTGVRKLVTKMSHDNKGFHYNDTPERLPFLQRDQPTADDVFHFTGRQLSAGCSHY